MSPHLFHYDYRQAGFYFVTICIQHHRSCFGKIIDGSICLSSMGKIAQMHWQGLLNRFSHVSLHEFVFMPNHMHALLELSNVQTKPLHEVIRAYKAVTDIRRLQEKPWFAWQASFYDRIVRGEKDLNAYQNYILNNPIKWEQDSLYRRY
jgi:putative transposase